jgi:uncharacterized protein (DUF58 family)
MALGTIPQATPHRLSLFEAKGIADALPDLLVEARRVAMTVLAGWHGRRRSGPGETFWQFRSFMPGEAANTVDWRRSARDEHLYVREKEWEAVHTVWLWTDLTASMRFRSRLATASKRDRAVVLTLALAELLAAGGERIGIVGGGRPILSRHAAERAAETIAHLPEANPFETTLLRRFADVVLIGDFLDPIEEIEAKLAQIASIGARAHLVQVLDPVEETFPYSGRTEFQDPETGTRHVVGRAEQYREAYETRLAALRDRIGSLSRRLGWTFLIHRTDRPANEPLLALHARLTERTEPGRAATLDGRAA